MLLLLLAVAGCSGKPDAAKPPVSTRVKQEALAKSGLPGASAVGTALRVSDSAAARRKLEDSLARW